MWGFFRVSEVVGCLGLVLPFVMTIYERALIYDRLASVEFFPCLFACYCCGRARARPPEETQTTTNTASHVHTNVFASKEVPEKETRYIYRYVANIKQSTTPLVEQAHVTSIIMPAK